MDDDLDQELLAANPEYGWRWSQLWEAGYDSVTCELLAATKVDLHEMCEAKAKGCSDETALRIYL